MFALIAALFVSAPAVAQTALDAEVQFVTCGSDPQTIVDALGGEKLKTKSHPLYYAETPNKDLIHHDLIVRIRDGESGVQTAVKRNFALNDSGLAAAQATEGVECEQDTYLTSAKVGCTLRETTAQIGALTSAQAAYIEAQGGTTEGLRVYGPADEEAWGFKVNDEKVALDIVRLRGEIVSVKLSTRVSAFEVPSEQSAWRARLGQAGVPLCADQSGKTEDLLNKLMNP